jgi:hypothetical protein
MKMMKTWKKKEEKGRTPFFIIYIYIYRKKKKFLQGSLENISNKGVLPSSCKG